MTTNPTTEQIESVAYALVDCSMDIADRGGIPADVWEEAQDTARDLLTYCAREVAANLPTDILLAALVERGELTEEPAAGRDMRANDYRRLVTPWEVVA